MRLLLITVFFAFFCPTLSASDVETAPRSIQMVPSSGFISIQDYIELKDVRYVKFSFESGSGIQIAGSWKHLSVDPSRVEVVIGGKVIARGLPVVSTRTECSAGSCYPVDNFVVKLTEEFLRTVSNRDLSSMTFSLNKRPIVTARFNYKDIRTLF